MDSCVHPFVDDGTNTVHPRHVIGIVDDFDAPPTCKGFVTTFLAHATNNRDQVVRCPCGYRLLAIGDNIVSTSVKVVVSLVVVAALVATRFSSSINVSDECGDRRKHAVMALLPHVRSIALLFVTSIC
jgi:hypothetical protein